MLVALAFAQSSGRIATDTKLDLVVAPWRFLGRALHIWDEQAAFGQLQNQAYGYLFPMGPFFGVFDFFGVPEWVTQRLWWSLVLTTAFLGVVKLCGLLGIGAPWARILAGFAFALSPRMMSVIGPASIEVWPSAVAPWVLIPLVIGMQRGSPRRFAALSALAVTCVGGVNAAATFAVVPLAALWLLIAHAGPRRRALMLWWPPLVLLGTLWWIFPLFLLGQYSPPFLDYIESIDNTSLSTTLFDTLRGVSNWVPYVDENAWAGRDLLSEPVLIANGVVVLCLGMLGLARIDIPHRPFLVIGLTCGLLAVTIGHSGAVAGWFSDEARVLLDGALAPLRNTHKFDVLLRLPLTLGLCHAVTVLSRKTTGQRSWEALTARAGPAMLAVVALGGVTVPAWTGGLAPRDSFVEVPPYWSEAADWLGDFQNGRALLAPATPFGDYVWGKTADEPLQPLAQAPWAVRNLVPLAPGGNVAALDTISNQLGTGQGSQALVDFMSRMGIGTVVLRNDIDRGRGTTNPEMVRRTLVTTPGMELAATFGPNLGGGPRYGQGDDAPFISSGWQSLRPAIEVFSLDHRVGDEHQQSWSETPTLIGGPDALLAADSWGLTADRSVVMAPDLPPRIQPGSVILTDGNRRQEQAFGAVVRQRSAPISEAEPFRQDRRVWRYDQDKTEGWLTKPLLIGAESLTASSSRSDVGAIPRLDQAASPWAAFDSDPDTSWRPSRSDVGKPSWLRLDFGREREVGELSIRLDAPSSRSTDLMVTTQEGTREVRVQGSGPATVNVGRVRSLTISSTEFANRELAIADVSSPSLSLSRPMRLPEVPVAWGAPDAIVLQSAPEQSDGCIVLDGATRCASAEEQSAESPRTIDREVQMPSSGSYDLATRAQPYGGNALNELLQVDRVARITASSQITAGAAASPVQAIDGDHRSGWVADESDETPSLSVRWLGTRPVSHLVLETHDDLAASRPTRVDLLFSDGSSVEVPVTDGRVEFPEVDTSSVIVRFTGVEERASLGFDGSITKLPVGVSEIGVDSLGLRFQSDPRQRTFYCGSGPTVTVNGREVKTQVRASLDELSAGKVVDLRVCGDEATGRIDLHEGLNRVVVGGSPAFRPSSLLLTRVEGTRAQAAPIHDPSLFVTTHNFNSGWVDERSDQRSEPVVANGWQQSWILHSSGAVRPIFAPQGLHQLGLALGVVCLLAVILVAACPHRRSYSEVASQSPGHGRWQYIQPWAIVVCGGVLASWPGVGVACVAVPALWFVDGQREWLRPWMIFFSVMIAGVYYVLGPWAGFEDWAGLQAQPQLLVVFAISCLLGVDIRRPAFLKRSAGFSTTR